MALQSTSAQPASRPVAPESGPADWEFCELCGAGISREHPHLVDPAGERVLGACAVCAAIFSERAGARFKRVPTRVRRLDPVRLTDAHWDACRLPIRLGFFVRRAATGDVAVIHATPGGVAESLVPAETWAAVLSAHPALETLAPDVEAFLVTQVDRPAGPAPMAFVAPIDVCHTLAALLRRAWRGASGGPAVWPQIDAFFARLGEAPGAGRD